MEKSITKNPLNTVVIVAALGYFVDIYDLILFGIVREPSLRAIGVAEADLLKQGHFLLDIQMIGMLLGGIVWGVMGDKKGRLTTLFFTILMYSLANIANGFVQNMEQYAVLRFIAGFGLAGELGIGITLVAEVMTKESRGYGTMIVSGVGIAGAALGYLITDLFNWQVAYWAGGVMGLLLLALRVFVYESGMFEKSKHEHVSRGSFLKLFTNWKRFKKYLYCILIGVPAWYAIGILVFSSPEFAKNVFHINGTITGGKAIMYHYIGASVGSFLTGIISQRLKSRKKALLIALLSLTAFTALYFCSYNLDAWAFYFIIFLLGIAMGYWAIFVTIASEQFGTNIRATVATTVPNFVRGAIVPMTLAFQLVKGSVDMWTAGVVVGIVVLILSFISYYKIEETYHKELDYSEPF